MVGSRISHDSNPFATRFTRPGELNFLLPEGESIADLVSRLQSYHWWGQIVGPHGSGKSTLLANLCPALQAADRILVRCNVGPGKNCDSLWDGRGSWNSATQVVIDGYEQLSRWARWRIKSLCRRRGAGLLVTAHDDVGLPTLYRTQPSLELARQIVARLLPLGDDTIADSDIAAAFAKHPTSLRETLFSLYDLYESRRLARSER